MIQATDLVETFERERPRLRAIATRILGSPTEAEDVVQEAWFRVDRANRAEIENVGAWLTVVVSRLSLDHLRSRNSRQEESIDSGAAFTLTGRDESAESDVILEESV